MSDEESLNNSSFSRAPTPGIVSDDEDPREYSLPLDPTPPDLAWNFGTRRGWSPSHSLTDASSLEEDPMPRGWSLSPTESSSLDEDYPMPMAEEFAADAANWPEGLEIAPQEDYPGGINCTTYITSTGSDDEQGDYVMYENRITGLDGYVSSSESSGGDTFYTTTSSESDAGSASSCASPEFIPHQDHPRELSVESTSDLECGDSEYEVYTGGFAHMERRARSPDQHETAENETETSSASQLDHDEEDNETKSASEERSDEEDNEIESVSEERSDEDATSVYNDDPTDDEDDDGYATPTRSRYPFRPAVGFGDQSDEEDGNGTVTPTRHHFSSGTESDDSPGPITPRMFNASKIPDVATTDDEVDEDERNDNLDQLRAKVRRVSRQTTRDLIPGALMWDATKAAEDSEDALFSECADYDSDFSFSDEEEPQPKRLTREYSGPILASDNDIWQQWCTTPPA